MTYTPCIVSSGALNFTHPSIGDGGGSRGDRPPPRFQVGGQKYLSAPQVLSLKNTNKEALSTPQPTTMSE